MQTLPGPDPFTRPHPSRLFKSRLLRWGGTICASALLVGVGVAAGYQLRPEEPATEKISIEDAEQLAETATSVAEIQRLLGSQTVELFRRVDFIASFQHRTDDVDLLAAIKTVMEELSDYADACAKGVVVPEDVANPVEHPEGKR